MTQVVHKMFFPQKALNKNFPFQNLGAFTRLPSWQWVMKKFTMGNKWPILCSSCLHWIEKSCSRKSVSFWWKMTWNTLAMTLEYEMGPFQAVVLKNNLMNNQNLPKKPKSAHHQRQEKIYSRSKLITPQPCRIFLQRGLNQLLHIFHLLLLQMMKKLLKK